METRLTEVQKRLIREVADLFGIPAGAYNFRADGGLAGRSSTENIDIVSKEDGSGIDVRIKPSTTRESVYIPVVLSERGRKETVYNDFFVGENSDVTIVAGCGIDNCGKWDSEHDGIHLCRMSTVELRTFQTIGGESADRRHRFLCRMLRAMKHRTDGIILFPI